MKIMLKKKGVIVGLHSYGLGQGLIADSCGH
jgi:hypothetical protein